MCGGVAARDSPVKLANAIWPSSTTSRSVSLNLRPVRFVSRGYILTPYQHTRNPETTTPIHTYKVYKYKISLFFFFSFRNKRAIAAPSNGPRTDEPII